mgnify:FL=1
MDIKSMTLDELKDACQQMGEKPFRAKQLYDWMHHRLAGSYDEMTNLSLAFREKLKEQYPLTCLEKSAGAGVQNRRNEKIPVPP